ncbi:aminotransferase [Brucella thiophenivorans]|uniref:Phosphotransferase enzyme family protein n=1 Tax=Brucella thiophenivorans TaxID=571255 RepID=A0A256F9P5_9HYPH|nr:aminotransferase [Brucella thiophenivorans]OYR11436.1 phosphotransferase enzyme family protein [Brucella thiophenivorans]
MSDMPLFSKAKLPRPNISIEDAAEILGSIYGLKGDLRELGSQQDRNFKVDTATHGYVLKICRIEYPKVELEAQNAILQHLALKRDSNTDTTVVFPALIPSLNGESISTASVGGLEYYVRLLTFVEGDTLTARKYLSANAISTLGAIAGQVARNLADFTHPGLERGSQWDLAYAEAVVPFLLQGDTSSDISARIIAAMEDVRHRLAPVKVGLRVQAIHHDITDDNVVGRRDISGSISPYAVIDFGDMTMSWLVAELATTCASLLHHGDNDPFSILPAVQAFHAVCPLNEQELLALWPLIVERACVLLAASQQQLKLDPGNDYAAANAAHEQAIFDTATSVPPLLMEKALFQALGIEISETHRREAKLLFPDLDLTSASIVDLSTANDDLVAGNWGAREIESQILLDAAAKAGSSLTRYGEYRLTRTQINSRTEPESFALHIAVCASAQTRIVAPFDADISFTDGGVILQDDNGLLHIDGLQLADGLTSSISSGDLLGTISNDQNDFGIVRVQHCNVACNELPKFAKPTQSAAWSMLCQSPAALLGLEPQQSQSNEASLLEKRYKNLAGTQKHYYATPPQIERGWKEHLFDVEGRAYLDMVNNVTTVGHGHPRLAANVHKQWLKLNTNSRFHYSEVADFSERLAALAPDGLDTVFLVNSGSEANDLALRLAWAWSGQRNILCLLEAYHGWTVGSDAVSTSTADNPNALGTRPAWVHPVVSPNSYRGKLTAEEYVETVLSKLAKLDQNGEGLAGFICEPIYGNAGGIPLPAGYLKKVYREIRSRGGLCIADEVQVGYGRTGHYFWGFEEQQVVPDIITIAKGMGNGHPLGAVITRKEIADSLEKEGYFFSSAGGSPVSSVVGNTVLDIMEDEQLQANARIVGDHIKQRLEQLKQKYPLIGAIHGMGLYMGLEFVRDHTSLEPATEETMALCDRLLELGIIMQPTGDHLNIFKIKPPLCLTKQSADYFVDTLEAVLREGW